MPWSSVGEDALRSRCESDDKARDVAQRRKWLNDAFLETRKIIDDHKDAIERHRRVFQMKQKRLDENEIVSWADDLVLDRIYQFGMSAEIAHDWAVGLESRAELFRRWKKGVGEWTPEAERLLIELDDLSGIFRFTESALNNWADQLCAEDERRHPDVSDLPFEPIDLGPTNAARLPPVL